MCIIIYRPADNSLSLDMLKMCSERNKDGWGIMMPTENGTIETFKGLHFSDFKTVYNSLPKDVDMGIHFRIKTHGLIDLKNCHPFPVLTKEEDGEDMYLMHNGTINTVKMHDKNMSDTWHWNEILLRPVMQVSPKLLYVPAFKFFVEKTIGWSRMLILDSTGHFHFLSEDDWKVNKDVKDNCRYSIEPPKKYVAPPTKTVVGGTNAKTTDRDYDSYYGYAGFGYGGSRYNNRHYDSVHTYNSKGELVKEEGGGTVIGSDRFPEKTGTNLTVVKSDETRDQGVGVKLLDSPATTSRGVTEVQETEVPASSPDTLTEDQKQQEIATTEGIPEQKGVETEDSGLKRFSENGSGVENLKEWAESLDDLEFMEAENKHLSDLYGYGIIMEPSALLGVEFSSERTYILLGTAEACDELPGVDPEVFEGQTFEDILSWSKQNPEEAALFIYKMCG